MVFVALLALVSAQAVPVRPDDADPSAALYGRWSCRGRFVRSGKPIEAHLSFSRDQASGALIVRHDDVPPLPYHSLEMWSRQQDGGMRAAVADAAGMRWFASSGWAANVLSWNRAAGGRTVEQFVYVVEDAGTLRVDWLASRDAAPPVLGDTLTCHRADEAG